MENTIKSNSRKEAQFIQERINQLDKDIARLETEQMCIKILMNSLYGALG